MVEPLSRREGLSVCHDGITLLSQRPRSLSTRRRASPYLPSLVTTIPAVPARPRLGAIDIGTNSLRLVFAEVDDDGYRVLDEEREMTRIGEGLAKSGRLSEAAIERSLAALGKMKA